jgi:hypothetical protein
MRTQNREKQRNGLIKVWSPVPWKGLATRNTHNKIESSITNDVKDIHVSKIYFFL